MLFAYRIDVTKDNLLEKIGVEILSVVCHDGKTITALENLYLLDALISFNKVPFIEKVHRNCWFALYKIKTQGFL